MTYTLEQIRVGLDRHARRNPPEAHLSRGRRGVITAILDELSNSQKSRHVVLMWCFPYKWKSLDQVSSKDLTDSEWYALQCWIEPKRVMKGYWRGRAELQQEVTNIWMEQMAKTNNMKEVIDVGSDASV